jgi:hypothetical protein
MFRVEFKGDGFDKIKRDIEKLTRRVKELEGENSIPFNELFSADFLKKYTDFSSVDDMFAKSGFTVTNQDDFKNIPDSKWDEFIKKNTKFSSWEEMTNAASKEWIDRKLFG